MRQLQRLRAFSVYLHNMRLEMAFTYRSTEGSAKVGRLDRKVGATPGRKRRKRNLTLILTLEACNVL